MSFSAPAAVKFNADLSSARVVDGIFRGGAIYPSLSAVENAKFSCPEGIADVKYLSACKKFVMRADGKAYHSINGYVYNTLFDLDDGDCFIYEEYEDETPVGKLSCGKYTVRYVDNLISTRTESPKVYCGAFLSGRLFGAGSDEPKRLKWSGEKLSADVTEGIYGSGYVYIDGELGDIVDVAAYNGRIFVLAQNGLQALNAGGSPDAFILSQIIYKTPKIFGGTAQSTGSGLYFYTDDGLYCYSGGKVQKKQCPLRDDITSPTGSLFAGGKYFLCGKSRLLNRTAVLVYDDLTGSAQLIDVPAVQVAAADKLFAYGEGKIFDLVGGSPSRTFLSTDFGSAGKKCINYIEVEADSPVDIKISDGDRTRILTDVEKRRKLVFGGRSFGFEIISAGALRSFKAYAEEIDGI